MRFFPKRFIYSLSNKLQRNNPDDAEEKLVVDFRKSKKTPFDIKSESSYNSYLSNGSLALELKKSNCIAWVEIPHPQFSDFVMDAKIRMESSGSYTSAGIIFRLVDEDSYYLALVSNKGYFRIDAVKDNSPKALIAWTELADFDGSNFHININAYGNYLFFLVNGKWVGEINDDSINTGKVGFAFASYGEMETEKQEGDAVEIENENQFNRTESVCKAWLDHFTVDARSKTLEEKYAKWTDDSNINAEGRLRLAETFAVMGKSSKGLEQIRKAWKRRDDAIRSASVSFEEVRTKKELLLAARMSYDLGQYGEAEEYINLLLDQYPNSEEGKAAQAEKIKVLNELDKFAELKEFILEHSGALGKDINFYTTLARCHFELKEYKDSAEAWKKAFKMNSESGIYAVNAANALELAGKKKDALKFYFEAGKLFLNEDNQAELAAMMPKLSALGGKDWEARCLCGKWAYSVEDYPLCITEFSAAEKLRCALKPRPKADPALFYLWGLVCNINGKNNEAIRHLEKAVKLAPDYGLFLFKLAEIKLLNGAKDETLAGDLKTAIDLFPEEESGKMAYHAGNLLLKAGYIKKAEYFFARAGNAGN